ncbi:MAG: ion transporter [Candidatus Omnitrophica bacterium]|nr:ion transporter [Candidatus Omnitrophota bacterium]
MAISNSLTWIKNVVECTDTPAGRRFDLFIQFLIILSIVTFSIETLPNLGQPVKAVLRYIEVAVVLVFTMEYALRILVSGHKIRFIFSFFGLVDFLAILPFYLALGIDLRAIRALRLFRLVWLMKLARYGRAIERFRKAFEIAKEEVALYLMFTLILLFLSSVGIYYFEHDAQPDEFQSVFHAMWWAVATLSTVGYGDIYPVTAGGKVFTFFVLILGLGIVSVPSGLIASALMRVKSEEL